MASVQSAGARPVAGAGLRSLGDAVLAVLTGRPRMLTGTAPENIDGAWS